MTELDKPPTFFFPDASSDREGEDGYRAVARYIGVQPLPRAQRIYALSWVRKRDRHYAVVGEPLSGFDGEKVYAILHDGKNYCVCTPNHGVLSGYPLYIGMDESPQFVRFPG